jgi:hypothetical protein
LNADGEITVALGSTPATQIDDGEYFTIMNTASIFAP